MAYPFAAAEVLTAVDLNAMIGAPTQNAITTTTYTAVLLDAGKTVTLSNASAVTLTIPAQASVSWADNTQLNFLNLGAGTVTITPAASVTINGTPLTLATSKGGSLVRTASNTWTFTPTGGGGGKVLQVVRATDSGTNRTSTSTSFVDVTGMSVTITPQKVDSEILVIATGLYRGLNTATDITRGNFQITDSSNGALSGAEAVTFGTSGLTGSGSRIFENGFCLIGRIAPNTTSAVSYKLRFSTTDANNQVQVRNEPATGQIYAIEVSA